VQAKQLLRDQAIRFLRDQALMAYVAFLVSITGIGLLLHNDKVPIASMWVITLVILETVSLGLRYYNETLFKTTKRRQWFACIMNAVDAIAICSCLYFIPLVSVNTAIFMNAILLLLCTGSAITSAGYQPFLWSFSAPLLSIQLFTYSGYYLYTHTFIFFVAAFISLSGLFLVSSFAKNSRESLLLAMNAQLNAERANQSKTRFFAASTHDLRQPVAAAGWLCSTAINTNNNQDPNLDLMLNKTLDAINAIDEQLAPMMELARIDSGGLKINHTQFDMVRCLNEVILMFEPCLPSNIEFTHNFKVDQITCNSDVALVKRIISNIIDNSIKYTHQGLITVVLSVNQNDILVTIQDTGVGIAEDKMELIFDEFYQVDNADSNPARGYGLGLPIAKRLCEKISIKLMIESEINKYTKVTLTIPKQAKKSAPY